MREQMNNASERSNRIRSAIAEFLAARRDEKLKGREPEPDDLARYEYIAWIAGAARRVSQIRAVTHPLKATHPDARGTSVRAAPDQLPKRPEVGSHALGANYAEDVVGNAAALDVFKFLKIEVDGKRLFDWMVAGDADLLSALHDDPAIARQWMESFARLAADDPKPTSHELAKQVYWLVGANPREDQDFHLLQPMFSSSLAHRVHEDIDAVRFGEANKLARAARREQRPHDKAYREYRGLVARKLGGTKPQNVSQLNSERRGVNYLLASLPPEPPRERAQPMLRLASAFERFRYYSHVRGLVRSLVTFLASNPEPTVDTRRRREGIEQALTEELCAFAADVRSRSAPGWTRQPDCQLPMFERLWLDPERVELPDSAGMEDSDAAFRDAYHRGDWPDQVAEHFAKWLNAQLRDGGVTLVGDAEAMHWAKQAVIDAAWPVPQQRRIGGGGA